jgi:hypothetical protein
VARRTEIQAAITIAVVVWGVMLAVEGVALHAAYLRPYSVAVGAAVIAMIGYERWFWRWRGFRRLTRRPDLQGTWAGTLRSSWIDPSTGRPVAPIPVFLVITQSFSTVAPRLLTAESSSQSVAAELHPAANGTPPIVWSTYVNTPRVFIQERSRTHHGALRLEVHGSPDRLTGTYWTDRQTTGEIVLDRRTRRVHTSFGDAAADPEFDATANGRAGVAITTRPGRA